MVDDIDDQCPTLIINVTVLHGNRVLGVSMVYLVSVMCCMHYAMSVSVNQRLASQCLRLCNEVIGRIAVCLCLLL